jgi:alpha-glucosidase
MNLIEAHHDGSEIFVSNSAPKIGQSVELKVRIPAKDRPNQVFVRLFHDGEPRTFELTKSKQSKIETWWSVKVEIQNTVTHYRFMLVDKKSYRWLNGMGVFAHDVTDREDFQIIAKPSYPQWIKKAVFYQIFPDRFAKSEVKRELPSWAVPKNWSDLPKGKDKTTGVEFYGGDLPGITSKISHIKNLGASAIYFTPAFPGRSNHRYDASSFDEIDPLLGGNSAMAEFSAAAHKNGLKIMGDLTTNHCGAGHPWIQKALKSSRSKTREFFYWDSKIPHGYVGWWGLASLPKLNYTSHKLRGLIYRDKNSVIRKWLKPPYNFDGWRIDVGNMTGRYLDQDINQEIARGIRNAMDETKSDAWLVAENADHSPADLDGFGWHGTMNYNGFARPLVNWLNQPKKSIPNFSQFAVPNPVFSGTGTVHVMRAFAAGIPWRSLVASMVLLDSHDTARFKTVVGGDRSRHLAGVATLLTYPGVPSIFAGDEIGLEGEWGEDARRTIDWENPEKWDGELFSEFKKLVEIRKSHDALINGGLRWVYITDSAFAYLRESKRESILVFISRSAGSHTLNLEPLGYKVKETLYGKPAKGNKIKINSQKANCGIWLLK